MVKTPLDFRFLFQRKRLLEKKKSLLNENVIIPDLSDVNNNVVYRDKINNYLEHCWSYVDAIEILESLYQDNNFALLESSTHKTISNIIPMVANSEWDNCLDYIQSANIGNVNKDLLTEAVKRYKRLDRIENNHNNLIQRFDLSNIKHLSDKDLCFKICEMVDTYKLSKYIKFNIALEEISYLGFMNGKKIPDEVIVENVTNYFLMIDENTQEDIDSYKKAIKKSQVLSENADSLVPYLYSTTFSNYWKDRINQWKVSPDKKLSTLVELAKENCSNIPAFNSIISLIDEFCTINTIDFHPMKIFNTANTNLSSNEIQNFINVLESSTNDSEELIDEMQLVWEAKVNNEVYENTKKSIESFTSDEIDHFKMKNLIDDSKEVETFLNHLEKTSIKESNNSITRLVDYPISINESNKIDYVDDNGYISIPIRSYTYKGIMESVVNLLDSSIKCLNNILYNHDTQAYYQLHEGQFDIFLKSKYEVILSEAQELARDFSPYDKFNLVKLHEYVKSLEDVYNSSLPDVADKLVNDRQVAATITAQEAALLYELLNPLNESSSNYNKDGFFDKFLSLCKYEANPQYNQIKEACNNIKASKFNYNEDNLSRVDLSAKLLGINEVKVVDKAVENLKKATGSNNKDSGKEEKKSALTLNNIKLSWEGIKSKFKKASAKEQEMSRDLDMLYNHLSRTVKDFYTLPSDTKSAMITGEVKTSISKVIKIGIVLAGAGALCGAIVPILGLIALIAKSKYLSRKDRLAIIDTCDIELKVVEREIAKVENQEGSSAQYRQLLTIKKNLQRKRQEMYLGSIVSGAPLPVDSNVGQGED